MYGLPKFIILEINMFNNGDKCYIKNSRCEFVFIGDNPHDKREAVVYCDMDKDFEIVSKSVLKLKGGDHEVS